MALLNTRFFTDFFPASELYSDQRTIF